MIGKKNEPFAEYVPSGVCDRREDELDRLSEGINHDKGGAEMLRLLFVIDFRCFLGDFRFS